MKKKNIIIMYIITFLQGMVFYASIATLYRTSNGITLLEMGIIESICSILIIILEIPWGIICDKIGYKKTLIVCNFVYFISKIVFYNACSFNTFLLERLMMAFVVAGLSGCDTALLYESTTEEESTKVFGYYRTLGTLGMILASCMFSLFIKNDISKTALWTIYTYGIAFIFTFFLEDVSTKKKESTQLSLSEFPKYLNNLKRVILFVLVAGLLTETTHTLNTFYNQLQYERASIPVEYFGFLYVLITLCSLSSASIGKLTKRFKEEKIILYLLIFSLFSCLLLRFTINPIFSVICIGLLTVIEALFFPMMDTIFNRHVSINRATTLSIYSMILNMIGVGTNIIFGRSADRGIVSALNVGCIFISIALIVYIIWLTHVEKISKINNRNE